MTDRRPYRRESTERRRDDLISAALDLVSEGGPQAATVRAIAQRAGVTPGLIRHYFLTKEDLTRAAYQRLMDRMTADSAVVLQDGPDDPAARLAWFVAASISPPVVDPVAVGLWAGFLHGVQRDKAMREVHIATYLGFRDVLQSLIAALPRTVTATGLRGDAIACNAIIDGLWLEGSVLPEAFGADEIVNIGLTAIGAILQTDLVAAKMAAGRALP